MRSRAWRVVPSGLSKKTQNPGICGDLRGSGKAGATFTAGDIIRPRSVNGCVFCCTIAGITGDSEPEWVGTVGEATSDGTVVWRCQAPGARDVLYFSNFGDPTRVPIMPSALQQVPATYGGWADLERWGHDVTGLAAYGSVLIAMKRQGIWACQGDPGDNSFRIDELDRREGCLSHESIVQAEGRLLWQARDKILALEGMAITDISLPIAPTVQAYAAAQQEVFGIYDPQQRRCLLFYPHGDAHVDPRSEALVLQLKTGAWTQYTAQPGACGLHTQHAAIAGVYLADFYGADGDGKLFRLGGADDALNDGTTAAIAWQWVSGELPSPFVGRYTQVYQVRGHVLTADTTGPYTLAAAIYPNNDSAPHTPIARALTLRRLATYGVQGTGIAQWTPPPQGELESFAVKLGRATSDVVGMRSLSITCLPRVVVRGRSGRE